MKKVFFITVFLFLTYSIYSQKCISILEGSIVDYHDKTALNGAIVQTLDGKISAVTDRDGKFRISGLCNTSYNFEISHPECNTTLVNVTISGNTIQEFKLEHHLEELDEVKVTGSAINKTNSSQEISLKAETIEAYSSATLGDALKEITGVSSLNTGANIVKPAIHGLNGSRVLILNNGVRMQDMEWGDEHAPNIDLNAAGFVTVIKGASALKYGGDAIGGVVLLEQQRFKKLDSLYGKTIVNGLTNGRGGSISSELVKTYESGWFLKGQASFKRLGDRESPSYVLSNTGIKEFGASFATGKNLFEWGWNLNYSYYNAEIAILRASHIGNTDDLIRSINSNQPEFIRPFTYDLLNPRQKVEHHLGKLKFYKRFEGLGKWDVQYDFQQNNRLEFDIRRGEDDDRQSLDLQLTTHSLVTNLVLDAKKSYELNLGLLVRYQDNFANPDTGVRRLIPDYKKYDAGSFILGEWRINDSFVLDGGVRYDFNRIDAKKFYLTSRWQERGYNQDFQNLVIQDLGNQLLVNPVFDYHNFSFSTGLSFQKDNNSALKINYALAQRAPNPSELFSDGLHHSAARIELGDLRISSETSHKFSLSQQRDFLHWGFVLEPYANFINDFILLEPTGVEFTIRGAFPVWGYRQTDARLLGLDASAYIQISNNIKTDHRFSIVKAKDISNNEPLINIPAANLNNKVTFSKEVWNNFEVSLESQYVFRQNEFPENINVFSPEQQQEVLLAINTPPNAYHLLNLNTQAKFSLSKKLWLKTNLTVTNILNTNYRDYLNRQRFFANDLGRNIILQLKLNY